MGFQGRPIDYVEGGYTSTESWELLSESFREWAESRAGPAIRDPHTGVDTVYWSCRVRRDPAGPRAAARGATYDLVMFGRRGLVVSSGTTDRLVDRPGATRWRHRRFDLPVDPSGVRNDHHREAPGAADAARGGPGPRPGDGDAPGRNVDLLPADLAERFGNLPLRTQQFLLQPFVAAGSRPSDAGVDATIVDTAHEHTETLWVHVFNGACLGFAHARRSATRRRGLMRTGRRSTSAALGAAPWTVAAWVAPVDRPGRGLVRS